MTHANGETADNVGSFEQSLASLEQGRLLIGSSRSGTEGNSPHPRHPALRLKALVSPGRGFSFAGPCPCLLRLCNLGTGLSSTSVISEEYAQ